MSTIQLREKLASLSPARLLIVLAVSIFSAEAIIMSFLHMFFVVPLWVGILMDSFILTIVIFPVLYLSVYRPFGRRIIECRKTQQALKDLSEQLGHILDNTPAIHYTCRVDGENIVPTYASPNLKGLMGYGPEEYLGNPGWWSSGISPEGRNDIFGGFRTVMASNCLHYCHEYEFRYKDGTYHWIHDELQIIRDQAGSPQEIVGSWLDVTDRKKADEEQGRLLKEVERNNRELQEKSKYLERLNRQMVGRETRMLELKKEVNDLLERLGEAKRYEWTAEQIKEKA